MKISAIVLAKNEQKTIKDCLKRLFFCREVIVINDFSSDKTKKIALAQGAKVFDHPLKDNYSTQRNYGLEIAKYKWALFIDADEEVSPALAREIRNLKPEAENYAGFYLKRKNYFLGKAVGEDKILRLARKNSGQWRRRVHESWQVEGKIGHLKNSLLHHTAASTSEMLAKINYYSTLHARANFDEGKRANLLKIIIYPPAKYLIKLISGCGPVFSLLSSFHSYLAWSKLWLLQKNLIGKVY